MDKTIESAWGQHSRYFGPLVGELDDQTGLQTQPTTWAACGGSRIQHVPHRRGMAVHHRNQASHAQGGQVMIRKKMVEGRCEYCGRSLWSCQFSSGIGPPEKDIATKTKKMLWLGAMLSKVRGRKVLLGWTLIIDMPKRKRGAK